MDSALPDDSTDDALAQVAQIEEPGFTGAAPVEGPAQGEADGLLHGPPGFPPAHGLNDRPCRHCGLLSSVPVPFPHSQMFVEADYWCTYLDGPRPTCDPMWDFVAGRERKGWWKPPVLDAD